MTDQTDIAPPAARPGLLRRMLAGLRIGPRPSPSLGIVSLPDRCPCGEDHGPQIAAALFGGRPVPKDGESTGDRQWAAAFADKVKPGDLLGMPSEQLGRRGGLRALEVRDIRKHVEGDEHGDGWLTFLLADADSGDVFSPTVSKDHGFRVAVVAPDSVPVDFGGAAS